MSCSEQERNFGPATPRERDLVRTFSFVYCDNICGFHTIKREGVKAAMRQKSLIARIGYKQGQPAVSLACCSRLSQKG